MKRLKFNYLPILITLTLCLVGFSCRKENSAVVDSTPTVNEQVTSRSDEEIVFVAQIVARRTDVLENSELGEYFQNVFDAYPECQTILHDGAVNYYFGNSELAPDGATEMVGYFLSDVLNDNLLIAQPSIDYEPPPYGSPFWKYILTEVLVWRPG